MIYLDHAATTPLDPRVLEAMLPYLREQYGNPSSVHGAGRRARVAVEEARERIAGAIGSESSEIVFTSGGTEGAAMAVRGRLMHGGRLVTSAVEHEAVLRPAERLARGGRALILSPTSNGAVTADQVADALEAESDVRLVSVMTVNNETGTITPITEIAAVCARIGVSLHTDAVQAVGLLDVNVDALGVDLLSASAHKFYGPKGAGFLYVRGGTEIEPLIEGSQERKRRGGTENVAAIVGMARALELAMAERSDRIDHARGLRRRLLDRLGGLLDEGTVLNTPHEEHLAAPHIVNVSFPPIDGRPLDGEMLILNLDMEGVAASAGSACSSGAMEPSHVLLALGRDRATAAASVRFSPGVSSTEDDIDRAVDVLESVVRRMRRLAVL